MKALPSHAVRLLVLAAIVAGAPQLSFPPASAAESSASATMPFMNHPGAVRMVDEYTHEVRVVPLSQVPESQRFVFYKGDEEIASADGATRAVPIVEVRMFSLDADGKLVDKAHAARLRIIEIGPGHQPLRTTLLLPNR
ncbi:MAG TPA: hypothetical protein VIP05_34480 [Burkholderiaceae bacterium]